MTKTRTVWIVLALLATAGSLLAHHSLAQFDTTTPVRVKGAIVFFARVNPHSVIFVDQTGADGKTQRWALEGPGLAQLNRLGIQGDSFKIGDVIEACGYALKEGLPGNRTISTEPISLSLKPTRPKEMTGRLLEAELLVTDGKPRRWSDYGVHKCFEPGVN